MRHRNYRLNEGDDVDAVQRKLKNEYKSFQDYFDILESALNKKNTTKLVAKACANLSVIARLIAVLSIYAECLEEISDPREAKKLLKDRINSLASAHTISRTTAVAYTDIADEIDYWAM